MNYTWLTFALLSAVTAALVAIFGKIGLAKVDSNVATAIRAVIMAVFLIGVIIFQGKFMQIGSVISNSKAITFIVLSGLAGAMSWLFYFMALKIGKASQVAPIDRLSVVFVLIFAAIFLGEGMNWKTAVGTGLIASGAILVALG